MKIFVRGLNPCDVREINIETCKRYLALQGHAVVETVAESDVIFLWLCAFRSDYRDNSLAQIRRMQKDPSKKLVVGGCLPAIAPQALAEIYDGPIIDWKNEAEDMARIFGENGHALTDDIAQLAVIKKFDNLQEFRAKNPESNASFADQFNKLYISQGCTMNCSYCSEKKAFPSYRSYPQEKLISECVKVVEQSGDPIILLQGDSTGEYGHDIGSSLPQLMHKMIAACPELKISIQNCNPAHWLAQFDDMLVFFEKQQLLHLRFPIQSASTKILKVMNRPYDEEQIEKLFSYMANIGFDDFSTDLIIGFPGEQEDDYKRSIDFLLRYIPKYVNLSMYMDEPMLDSYKLPDKVPAEVARRRVVEAHDILSKANIYCNTDGGQSVIERQRRINAF